MGILSKKPKKVKKAKKGLFYQKIPKKVKNDQKRVVLSKNTEKSQKWSKKSKKSKKGCFIKKYRKKIKNDQKSQKSGFWVIFGVLDDFDQKRSKKGDF